MMIIISREWKRQIEASIMEQSKRTDLLEEYAAKCSLMHEKAMEHWEKQDATLKDLTMSNMRLANSLDSVNTTISDIVKNDRPQSEFVKGWRITLNNNKLVFIAIAAFVGLLLSIVQLTKSFM